MKRSLLRAAAEPLKLYQQPGMLGQVFILKSARSRLPHSAMHLKVCDLSLLQQDEGRGQLPFHSFSWFLLSCFVFRQPWTS